MEVITRTIGRSTLSLACVEHNAPVSTYPVRELDKLVAQTDRVIIEYFTPELNRNAYQLPVLGGLGRHYSDQNGVSQMSDLLSLLSQKHQKDILVMDPANSFWFELLYQFSPFIFLSAGAVGLAPMIDRLMADSAKTRAPKFSRANFIKKLGLIGLPLSADAASWRLEDYSLTHPLKNLYRDDSLNLKDMRWVTVAEAINQYCQTDQPLNLAAVYPPDHVKDGIVYYLDNPDLRRTKYNLYQKIPGIERAIRQYSPDLKLKVTQPIQ